MQKFKIAFIIDKLEFQYFEFNELITSFWLIKECNVRGWDVYVSTSDKLLLDNGIPKSYLFKTSLKERNGRFEMTKNSKAELFDLNKMDAVFFRPDPPITMNYICCTYILDFIDRSRTIVFNDPAGIRKANEKVYINNFPELIPENIVTSNPDQIRQFIDEYGEVVLKPLDKCFGKGVFCLNKGDKNINSIIDTSTEGGKIIVMVQRFLSNTNGGDKRINIIGGEVYEEGIIKISGEGDFKFNSQKDEYFKKGDLTDNERLMCRQIADKLVSDGLYLVGIDVLDDKIIEINVTSPCFFIKEINKHYNINLELRITDYIQAMIVKLHNNMAVKA